MSELVDGAIIEDAIEERFQLRNSFVFLANTALAYLIAPVSYVGVLHAAILDSLQASDTVANLPEAVFLWVAPLPVLAAWLWPSPRLLRPMLTSCLLANGAAGGLLALLFLTAPGGWLIPTLIVHAAVIGVTNGVRNMCLWELIGRGLSPAARARTLGWTFGIGPLFAVLGSCISQLVLSGEFLGLAPFRPPPAPWNYAILFGATCPVMWLSAALVRLAHVPAAAEGDAGARLADVARGLRAYFLNPLIVAAALGFLLTYGGTMIMNNVSLYAREALGEPPEKYAGLQLALRFGFKCLAGFALGWLVTKIHAKASLMATTAVCIAGVAWAWLVPGKWYLLSFGLLGAGELFYVYYLNYIVGCSSPQRIRQNTAYTNLLTVLVGWLPLLFGLASDHYGLRFSFGLAIGILTTGLAIVAICLPREPRAPDAEGA
ncbi:MAG TPA: hypothetical protein VHC19_06700 [Pirellulales bacterium]|nr:hypothetical protein [Pirellulales bacterium]